MKKISEMYPISEIADWQERYEKDYGRAPNVPAVEVYDNEDNTYTIKSIFTDNDIVIDSSENIFQYVEESVWINDLYFSLRIDKVENNE